MLCKREPLHAKRAAFCLNASDSESSSKRNCVADTNVSCCFYNPRRNSDQKWGSSSAIKPRNGKPIWQASPRDRFGLAFNSVQCSWQTFTVALSATRVAKCCCERRGSPRGNRSPRSLSTSVHTYSLQHQALSWDTILGTERASE